MSPFTMALAFDSPIVKDINSATGSKGVVDEIGNMQLRFGVVDPMDGYGSSTDPKPVTGMISGRLGFGESQAVVKPRKGLIFRE